MKTYLFDFDGTLVDSEYVWDVSFDRYFHEEKISASFSDFRQAVEHMTIPECTVYMHDVLELSQSPEEIYQRIHEIVIGLYQKEVKPIGGMAAFIRQCHQQGIQLGVVTSNRTDIVELVLHRFGIRDCFEKLYCNEDTHRPKKDPKTYEYILEDMHTTAQDTLLFEDTYYAIASAAQCGIQSLAIRSEINAREMAEHNVKMICDYTELL